MVWYEIVALFFFLGSCAAFLGVLGYFEHKRNKMYCEMLRKQMAFYDIAGEWFYNHR